MRALPRGVSKAPAGRLAGTDGAEKDGTEETDEALIARMRDGDSGALAELWTRYTGLLYTQAHAILHNPVDSEEVVAEMFVEVWQRADNYHPERARPVAWLVTLVRRRAIDKLRERRSYEKAGARLSEESAHSGPWADGGNGHSGEGVVDQMRLAELRGLLESVMGQLPESQRETVRMVYFMGLTQKEISLRTRTPLGTVKTRLELGLRKMRDRIRGSRMRALARGTEEL